MRGFLKRLSLVLVLAYAQLFTLAWLNAYTFGYETTVYVDRWGEATLEGLVLFGLFWPVVTVGLYFLAVDGGEERGVRPSERDGVAVVVDPEGRNDVAEFARWAPAPPVRDVVETR